jgi:CheY-like chemotaxis protein
MRRKTVLIVEDHEDFRESLAELLRLEGWATLLAASAEQAIEVARAGRVHVVLTDIVLGRTSGTMLERAFRSDPALEHIPFIFMTGSAPHLEQIGRHRGLLKPFPMENLCAMLAASTDGENRARPTDPG